jgi:hypothetical protein
MNFTLRLEGPFDVVLAGRLAALLPAFCAVVQRVLVLVSAFGLSADYSMTMSHSKKTEHWALGVSLRRTPNAQCSDFSWIM